MLYQPIKFGHLTARIEHVRWDSARQVAHVVYRDDLGLHSLDTSGASVSECRRAVADHMMNRIADAREG